MVRFARRPGGGDRPADEDEVLRRYRFLLRRAAPDAVEDGHKQALSRLRDDQRRLILLAVQRGLVAGGRLQPQDTSQIAHLIVLGERRSPNAFLEACEQGTLLALAQAVSGSEACLGQFGPYVGWDGADQDTDQDPGWAEAGFNPDSGRWHPAHDGKAQESGFIDAYYGGRGIPHKGRRP